MHREWFHRSALADLLGEGAGLAQIHKLYRCHDRLLLHKQAVFDHLVGRWRDVFNIRRILRRQVIDIEPIRKAIPYASEQGIKSAEQGDKSA